MSDRDHLGHSTTDETSHRVVVRPAHQLVIDLRTFLLVIALIALSASAFYVFLRLRTTYQTVREATLAAQQAHEQAEDFKAFREQMTAELNAIKATVYGPRTPAAKPSAVELWQRNRDAEIQKRLRAVEQWRYRMDER